MAIDAGTQALMTNWALWRICREQPGLALSNAYSLMGGSPSAGPHGPIVLLNDEAFEVEQALNAMADYLRQAIVEYWIRSEDVPRKARRCSCSVRTFWYRLERGHQAVHTYRQELQARQKAAREAYKRSGFSVGV